MATARAAFGAHPDLSSPETDFGLCPLQRLSRRLVAVQLRSGPDFHRGSETLHIVDSSIDDASDPVPTVVRRRWRSSPCFTTR